MRDAPKAVAQALGTSERKTNKGLMWGMRKNPSGMGYQANRCDASAAAFGPEERASVATEAGAARGLCAGCGQPRGAARADLNA